VAATLFVVALLLIALILRDQRKAIRVLNEAATTASSSAATVAVPDKPSQPAEDGQPAQDGGATAVIAEGPPAGDAHAQAALHLAVERGRIAMMGGLVSLIWLVILVLMVWR
jgi:hypothetical protein